MGGEVTFHHESLKGMGQFEGESFITHSQNARIVFKVELQTSFWHSLTIFLENL